MKVTNQDDLVWDLVDVTRTSLDTPTINRVSITMANGDYAAVVEMVLTAAVGAALPLPTSVCTRLEEWLGYYSEHPSAENLAGLLTHATRADQD
jgi:hypothetical protein